MQICDLHSHILPEMDDGARSVEESLELIASLKKQGIHNICFTPHFYTHRRSIDSFLEKRANAYAKFLPEKPEDVNIVLGAEVYVTKYLFKNDGRDDFSGITYGKSRYILTEYGYESTFSGKTLRYLDIFQQNHGLVPIIPHVERYGYLIDNPDVIRDLRHMGVIIQTNISNYTAKSPFFKKRKLLRYISEGLIDVLGSDAHSFTHNTPEVYAEAMNIIADKCGKNVVYEMAKKSEIIFDRALNGDKTE